MDWEKMLKETNYHEGEDEQLIDEAIIQLEDMFELMDKEVLLKRSRAEVLAYLALKRASDKLKSYEELHEFMIRSKDKYEKEIIEYEKRYGFDRDMIYRDMIGMEMCDEYYQARIEYNHYKRVCAEFHGYGIEVIK